MQILTLIYYRVVRTNVISTEDYTDYRGYSERDFEPVMRRHALHLASATTNPDICPEDADYVSLLPCWLKKVG